MRSTPARSFWSFILFVCCFQLAAHSQNNVLYKYQDLSHLFYQKQLDSLKKAWVCPVLSKNKETQKKYKEFWDSRTEFITKAIANKDFVHEPELYNYLDKLVSQIVAANPQYTQQKPMLLIDRSSSANAYAIGGNIIVVNLGLLTFANYREDIAMVLAHELSHNILNHTENAIKEQAEWFTSEEYNKSLNAVLDSRYERYSRLKKILEGYGFSRNRHQRYKESDADSLSIILLKNAKIDFDASFFLKLDSSDLQYKQPLKNPLKTYLTKYGLPFEESWTQRRSKGLSTRTYNFKDSTIIEDSLKTHPDCIVRYNKTVQYNTAKGKHSPLPSTIQAKANKMIIWNLFDNEALTACMYRILLEKDKGNNDDWFDFMFHNVFAQLFYADKELNRFNAIGIVKKEIISKDCYELQNMFEQMPREMIEKYCKQLAAQGFWQKASEDATALRGFFDMLNFDANTSDKARLKAAKEFLSNYSSSMYCEYTDHFVTK